MVDALVIDAHAVLAALHDLELVEAAELLAVVAGQDVETGTEAVFRIAKKVARDRVIPTLDPKARHGHKSRSPRSTGTGHTWGVDPDDELITAVAVTQPTPQTGAPSVTCGDAMRYSALSVT